MWGRLPACGGLVARLACCALAVGFTDAALLPDHLGPTPRTAVQPAAFPPGQALAAEYGLTAAEQAAYGPTTITAYQFRDPTGAFAAAQAIGAGAILDGNYVLTCTGQCPTAPELTAQAGNLPKLYRGPYPMLPGWMPRTGQIAGSQRYVLGPDSLAAFLPRVPPAAVAFQFSPEAEIARYRAGHAEETLALFSYPTPSMARRQAAELSKVPGAAVRRDGPLVALLFGAPDPQAANRLLTAVGYHAEVAANQPLPLRISPQSAVKMVLAGFELAGILLLFCLFSGLLFGAVKVLSRRFGSQNADEPMVVLHLVDK